MKVKTSIIIIIGIIALTISIRNYRVITNPNQELVRTVASSSYWNWKVDLLLWRGAEPHYKNGQPFEAIFVFEHYDLLEKFGSHIPDSKSQEMYELSKKYINSKELDERVRGALRIVN